MAVGIIVKNYEHFNRSFSKWNSPKGRYIKSRADYEKAMHDEGMVSYEKGQELAAKAQKEQYKQYDGISVEAKHLLQSVNKGKKGVIKLGDRQVKALEGMGMKFTLPDWCPKHYKEGSLT